MASPLRYKVDWAAIQRLYAAGDYTFDQIAEIFAIPATAIRKRASDYNWKQLRQNVSQRLTNADGTLNNREEEIVDSAIRVGGKSTFRPRVAVQSERLLASLEKGEIPEDLTSKDPVERALPSRCHGGGSRQRSRSAQSVKH
jgi:hypothetical protein